MLMLQCTCTWLSISRGVLIYRIGKISAANMAKFSVSAIIIFLKLYRYFYQYFNWLILLMHCLVVTIFYCVDNHFTSFIAILLLTIVYNEFYYIICAIHGKNSLLCILDWLSVSASFQTMNIGYRKTEKFDIGIVFPLIFSLFHFRCSQRILSCVVIIMKHQ